MADHAGTPPWISSFPKDSRGFPVPAEAGWVGGEPVIGRVAVTGRSHWARNADAQCAVSRLPLPVSPLTVELGSPVKGLLPNVVLR